VISTACDYCIVAGGYKVSRRPMCGGRNGGSAADQNAFGEDFPVSAPVFALGPRLLSGPRRPCRGCWLAHDHLARWNWARFIVGYRPAYVEVWSAFHDGMAQDLRTVTGWLARLRTLEKGDHRLCYCGLWILEMKPFLMALFRCFGAMLSLK